MGSINSSRNEGRALQLSCLLLLWPSHTPGPLKHNGCLNLILLPVLRAASVVPGAPVFSQRLIPSSQQQGGFRKEGDQTKSPATSCVTLEEGKVSGPQAGANQLLTSRKTPRLHRDRWKVWLRVPRFPHSKSPGKGSYCWGWGVTTR